MERVYFSINETGAKTANDMMSFSEYKTGSKTAGYKAQVDKAVSYTHLTLPTNSRV